MTIHDYPWLIVFQPLQTLGDPSPFFFPPGRGGVAHHDGEVREAIRGARWCLDGNEVEAAIGARVGVLAIGAQTENEPRGVPWGLRKP